MLLTLLVQLNMVGGDIPPFPITPTHVGGWVIEGYEHEENERRLRHEKLLKDDNEILTFIKIYVQNK